MIARFHECNLAQVSLLLLIGKMGHLLDSYGFLLGHHTGGKYSSKSPGVCMNPEGVNTMIKNDYY